MSPYSLRKRFIQLWKALHSVSECVYKAVHSLSECSLFTPWSGLFILWMTPISLWKRSIHFFKVPVNVLQSVPKAVHQSLRWSPFNSESGPFKSLEGVYSLPKSSIHFPECLSECLHSLWKVSNNCPFKVFEWVAQSLVQTTERTTVQRSVQTIEWTPFKLLNGHRSTHRSDSWMGPFKLLNGRSSLWTDYRSTLRSNFWMDPRSSVWMAVQVCGMPVPEHE